jgi:hypothetical protein
MIKLTYPRNLTSTTNFKITALLRNYSEPVEVTSIDFSKRTFTWNYRGHMENVESFDDAEFMIEEGEQTP